MYNPLHSTTPEKGSVRPSKPRLGPVQASAPNGTPQATSRQAVTSGHNVFRPDIYRVSEGYMN